MNASNLSLKTPGASNRKQIKLRLRKCMKGLYSLAKITLFLFLRQAKTRCVTSEAKAKYSVGINICTPFVGGSYLCTKWKLMRKNVVSMRFLNGYFPISTNSANPPRPLCHMNITHIYVLLMKPALHGKRPCVSA